jgi:hypothetical protein
LPSTSNSSTDGAGTQHFERGGLRVAAFLVVGQRARAVDHPDVPCQSTVMPPTWPRIQLLGNCFGQDASTAKIGISPAEAVREGEKMPSDTALAIKSKKLREKRATASGERL